MARVLEDLKFQSRLKPSKMVRHGAVVVTFRRWAGLVFGNHADDISSRASCNSTYAYVLLAITRCSLLYPSILLWRTTCPFDEGMTVLVAPPSSAADKKKTKNKSDTSLHVYWPTSLISLSDAQANLSRMPASHNTLSLACVTRTRDEAEAWIWGK